MAKIGKKWQRCIPLYKYFAGDSPKLDFSENAISEAYEFETYGKGDLKSGLFGKDIFNGYAVGKHWSDVQVKMWQEDLKTGIISMYEIYEDMPQEFHWWLEKVIGKLAANSAR